MEKRRAAVRRTTNETDITASVDIDGTGRCAVNTGINFLDHMITSLAKHSMMDFEINARSLDGIQHHLIEDTAISLGQAIDKASEPRQGITRFGHASVPMDESLAEATLDMIRRPYTKMSLMITGNSIEGVATEDLVHFFQSLLSNMNCCIHLTVRYGENDHHKVEAAVKSLAVAIRMAATHDPVRQGAPSTKGAM